MWYSTSASGPKLIWSDEGGLESRWRRDVIHLGLLIAYSGSPSLNSGAEFLCFHSITTELNPRNNLFLGRMRFVTNDIGSGGLWIEWRTSLEIFVCYVKRTFVWCSNYVESETATRQSGRLNRIVKVRQTKITFNSWTPLLT